MPFSTELQPLSLLQAVRAEGVQFIQRVCVYRKVKLFRCRVVVVWLVQKPQPQWKIDGRDIYLIERSIPPYPLDKLCSEVKQHKDRQHCFGKENLHAEITVFQPFSSPQCKRCLSRHFICAAFVWAKKCTQLSFPCSLSFILFVLFSFSALSNTRRFTDRE